MKTYPRSDRIGTRILEEMADLLVKDIKDPRLEMVTITNVKMSNNLRYARIYYSLVGDEKKKKGADEGFKRAMGFIKRELARRLRLRYMPDVEFLYDESFDYGSRIDSILKELNVSKEEED